MLGKFVLYKNWRWSFVTYPNLIMFVLYPSEISRDLVADVCVASITDKKASNKVLEIIEDEDTPPKVFNGLNM